MNNNNGICHIHIIYLCIIFVIVLGFMIVCFCKGRISEDAFQNVSFAATVSSILLALISIVLSMNAANTTSGNLGSMSEIESKLNTSLNRLDEISKIIARTEHKIDNLPSLTANIQTSPLASDASRLRKKSHLFMMLGSKTNEYSQYEDAAINELCTELDLHDVSRDVVLKGNSGLVFDAAASGNGLKYLIEVKICSTAARAQEQYRRFMAEMGKVFERYDTRDSLVYIIFVCKNNNKDEIHNGIKEIAHNSNPMISIVFYNLSELDATR